MEGEDNGMLLNVSQGLDEPHGSGLRQKVSSKTRWKMIFRTTHRSLKRSRNRARDESLAEQHQSTILNGDDDINGDSGARLPPTRKAISREEKTGDQNLKPSWLKQGGFAPEFSDKKHERGNMEGKVVAKGGNLGKTNAFGEGKKRPQLSSVQKGFEGDGDAANTSRVDTLNPLLSVALRERGRGGSAEKGGGRHGKREREGEVGNVKGYPPVSMKSNVVELQAGNLRKLAKDGRGNKRLSDMVDMKASDGGDRKMGVQDGNHGAFCASSKAPEEIPSTKVEGVLSAEERAQVFDESSDFASLGLAPALASHLEGHMGFSAPTHIQRCAMPVIVSGRDALVHSDTGSGKTLVYLAPILSALQALPTKLSRSEGTFALVLAPTRELCLQIFGVAQKLVHRFHWIVPGLVTGGENKNKEKARLRKGVTILMATPGRLLDHLRNTASFHVGRLRYLVFDEADRLLDLGFERDIMEILSILKASTAEETWQTILLSATLDQRLDRLASVSLHDPVTIGPAEDQKIPSRKGLEGEPDKEPEEDEVGEEGLRSGVGSEDPEAETYHIPSQLSQVYVKVPCRLRLAALAALLRSKFREKSPMRKLAVFFSTCDSVEFHNALFAALHLSADNGASPPEDDDQGVGQRVPFVPCPFFKLHGNLSQKERSEAFHQYKEASRGILLCTDVAARGLDFPALSCIVQYDPPGDPSDYVHRVGRTARLGQKGEAVLFLQPFELEYLEELSGHGVTLTELPLLALLDHIPFGGRGQGRGEAKRRKRGGGVEAPVLPEMHKGAAIMQVRLETTVGVQGLRRLATDAYRSFVRAYAAHKGPLKKIFHPKRLHLGHVAKSFALKDAPSMLGQSSTKQALKKQKEELSLKHQRKKRRLRAATMVE